MKLRGHPSMERTPSPSPSPSPTAVREVNDEVLQAGWVRLNRSIDTGLSRGKLSADEAADLRGRLRPTTHLEDLADCDLVIEAIVENTEAKREVFAALDRICQPATIL